jgi:glycolate oxidase FAD binding subunit
MGTGSVKADPQLQEFEALQQFEALVGTPNALSWQAIDQPHHDRLARTVFPHTPIACIVRPANQSELATVVTHAHQHRLPILPWGAGSKLDWGGLVGGEKVEGKRQKAEGRREKDEGWGMRDEKRGRGQKAKGKGGDILRWRDRTQVTPPHSPTPLPSLIAIRTSRINQLVEHAVGDLTVTVEAGMKFAELQGILAEQGQFLAIDPAYPDEATIGGIVATADTGSLRQRYNSVRDMLLGLSVVRADGQVAKAGGRVVKNVAGYDLMKLFTGSYGTLGIISQVTFRVYPLPEASQTVVLTGAATAVAQATQTVLNSALTPASMDLLSPQLTEAVAAGQGMGVALRFQSILPGVQQQVARAVEVAQALGLTSVPYTGADDTALWQRLREQICPAHQPGMITCKIGIRPTQAIALLQLIDTLPISAWTGQIHAASGLGRLVFPDPAPISHVLLTIRDFCQANSGFLSVLQAPVSLKQQLDVWGYTGNAIALMQRIKQQFDPQHLLSPGRFVGGI